MSTVVTNIIRIGNSQGIRIPKPLLEQLNFPERVTLEATSDGALVVRPARAPREGWAEAFQAMAANGDDALLLDVGFPLSDFDAEAWEW